MYAGLFDIDACALATGVLSDDIFSITAGTWNINVFPSKTMAPLDGGCMNSVFPTGNTLVEASSPTSAGNLDYVLRMMTADGSKAASYDELGAMLERTDAKYTDVLFFPFLYGSNVNLDAEGAFIGLRSSSERDQLLWYSPTATMSSSCCACSGTSRRPSASPVAYAILILGCRCSPTCSTCRSRPWP